MKKTIFAIFKTHFDYGYTDRKEAVEKKYAEEIFPEVMRVCEATQKLGARRMYKWTVPAFLLIKSTELMNETNRARLENLVANGQIACHALPFTMHTSLLDKNMSENMFLWTEEYCKRYGKEFPIAAKLTDVPGHTSAIIAPLVQRGVKFLHIGKNGASPAPDVPNLFWWEDKSGARILTMYDKLYGSELLPPKWWKFPVYLALLNTNDNRGAQSAEFVEALQETIGDRYDYRTATLNEFAQELLKCDLSSLPVIRGELSDTWIHGAGSYPGAMGKYRRSREEFYAVEKFAKEKGVEIEKERREFYENALIFSEHTFGINVLKFFGDQRVYEKSELFEKRKTDPTYRFAEQSWNDEKNYAEKMEKICENLKKKTGFRGVAQKKFPVEMRAEDDKAIVVYRGKTYKISYEYLVFGAESVHGFVKKYLTRYENWSVSDFGRMWYPEIRDRVYRAEIADVKQCADETEIDLILPEESYEKYGNFKSAKILAFETAQGLHIEFFGDNKDAIGYVEAGNFIIETEKTGKYAISQIGQDVNIENEIVGGGNRKLWAIDEYAKIGDSTLKSYDAPLVSFGKNAICRYTCGGRIKYKSSFCVNLFNNHWGTNFPQWIDGSYRFGFVLKNR